MKVFKVLISLLILLVLVFLLMINSRLYYQPSFSNGYNKDVYEQLRYLKARKEKGASAEMQQLFPEGSLFFESFYGLAWCDLISSLDSESKVYKEGIVEIDRTLAVINSKNSKSVFDGEMLLEYGVFYSGWSNYVLGKKIELTPVENRKEKEIQIFKNNCEKIVEALSKSKSPFLESYKGQCWPADMSIAIASLATYDRVIKEEYDGVIKKWVTNVRTRLDSNDLIAHSVDEKGYPEEAARGASQCLMLSFLPEIDETFSKEQYTRFKKLFVEKRLGLNAIREYPKNVEGYGDVDSGPVIWGIGTASTIVGHRAAQLNKDYKLSEELNNGIEAFGFPCISSEGKKFLGGYLDIADVFISWTRSYRTGDVETTWWQWQFHLWTLLILIPFFFGLFLLWKKK